MFSLGASKVIGSAKDNAVKYSNIASQKVGKCEFNNFLSFLFHFPVFSFYLFKVKEGNLLEDVSSGVTGLASKVIIFIYSSFLLQFSFIEISQTIFEITNTLK